MIAKREPLLSRLVPQWETFRALFEMWRVVIPLGEYPFRERIKQTFSIALREP